MDSVPPPPPWNSDDDFLLKNAIETGASLESLAKGVVSFSRWYSLRELRERWRSVLYDSDVSDEASAAMKNLELAKSNGNGTKEVAAPKRKTQTIRKVYNDMRKRLRTEVFFNSFDMALCDEMCIENNTNGNEIGGYGNVNASLNKDVNYNLLVNSLVNDGNQLGLVGARAGSSHSMSEDPIRKTIEDVPAPNRPVRVSLENENGVSETKEMIPHVSDALLNSPNGDGLMSMSIGETAADKQSDVNVDSNLLPSPCDIQGVGESQKLAEKTQLAMANGPSAVLEVVANSSGSSHGDVGFASDCENEVQPSGAVQKSDPKPANEFRLCSLNTEDPNIPSDDTNCAKVSDVVPNSENVSAILIPTVNISTVVVPNSMIPKPISIVKEVGYPDSSISNLTKREPNEGLKRKDTPSSSFAASQSFRPGLVPNIRSSKENSVAAVLNIENPAKNSISKVSRQSNNATVNINPSQSRLVHATMKHASSGHPAPEVVIALPSPVNTHPTEEEDKSLPEIEEKLICIDQEKGDAHGDYDSDSDEEHEVPYYSDAEGMILEMDLVPTVQDTNASTEVIRYQSDETKKTIMRLEQCAQSFVQRAIASRGALAVFYGRTLKKYIEKSEVIIGRSTADADVDIDLARAAKDAHKISRRQASIKMDANGSFIIKNLGKRTLYLNGKEVPKGQMRSLSAGSLIEIWGLAFIFDVNKKCVERFIGNVNEQNRIKE
ncbi:uncharacterized protein LOC127074640 [Lathyrus oleraceus]|uniref:FHA domain-containing protein n=1 Tax=Pisum sativum TaxID=3888 RepID=A0A9D4XE31_PEA|nr:uncharacterized protein LOC127074640 [Pisum sativum]XP_050871932.1 uncharacterized protein LOC127074640 [Pisum sativum]KAI5418517.1 hypothetical protein KIW84_042952 [Pisum sativum]